MCFRRSIVGLMYARERLPVSGLRCGLHWRGLMIDHGGAIAGFVGPRETPVAGHPPSNPKAQLITRRGPREACCLGRTGRGWTAPSPYLNTNVCGAPTLGLMERDTGRVIPSVGCADVSRGNASAPRNPPPDLAPPHGGALLFWTRSSGSYWSDRPTSRGALSLQ
jgi:hypothetical protein